MGEVVRECLAETPPLRPFLDTEHGPIHAFKDRKKTLPAPFDDECFRHTAWAHLASGGAGGGMRWPNRSPHVLTPGMREAQRTMAVFMPLIDWTNFQRRNWNEEVQAKGHNVFACGDERQAVVWLLRKRSLGPDGRMRGDIEPTPADLRLPQMRGPLRVTEFDTAHGEVVEEGTIPASERLRYVTQPFGADRAFAIQSI
jgi:mannan endo-1,4-beta-mannosidase